jgi:hypothetical protein
MTEVILHYTFFIYLVFTSKPENNIVTGLHEPIGPCNETEPVQTPFKHVSIICLPELASEDNHLQMFAVKTYGKITA